jgi:glycerophosphoryl diester phosphodiesterase
MVVGHRGVRDGAVAENTAAAVEAAVAQGAAWVELDVRVSGDGVPVLSHDPAVDGRVVAELDAAALRRAGVADLAAVLGALPESVGVDLELKNLPGEPDFDPTHGLVARVADALAATRPRPLLVSSFNPETLERARTALPEVPAGWLYRGGLDPAEAAEIAESCGAAVLAPHVDAPLEPADVAGLHERGLAVLVWTVGEAGRLRALAAAGVDAVCTDEPARTLTALGRAGG